MALTTTPASAGYGTLDNTETTIFSDACMSFWIKVASTSAEALLVQVTTLHGTNYFKLEAGDPFIARDSTLSGTDTLTTVKVKSASATEATFSWAVAASGKA